VQNLASLGLSPLELWPPELGTFDYLRDNMTSSASPSERSLHRISDLTLAYVTYVDGEQMLKISDLYLLPKIFAGQLKIVRRVSAPCVFHCCYTTAATYPESFYNASDTAKR